MAIVGCLAEEEGLVEKMEMAGRNEQWGTQRMDGAQARDQEGQNKTARR
jgi:hypothetical protein